MKVGDDSLKDTALQLFDSLADSYERIVELATLLQDRYWKKWLLETVKLGPRDLVLDIGCGTCLLEERMGGSGASVVGMDLTMPMIRLGQAKALPIVKFLAVGDADRLPFQDSTFDAVVSCYVPKYARPELFSSEVARVLKPGGRVVMYDFAKPKGFFSPFIIMYVQGVLGGAGYLLGLARRDSAFTFRVLPGIVQRTVWDDVILSWFGSAGISDGRLRRLTAGTVAGFAGVKTPRRSEHE